MTAVAQVGAVVCPLSVAGLLLAAATYLRDLALPHPSVGQILSKTGASRSRAYELRDTLLATLPSLQRPVGRPPAPPPEIAPDTRFALLRALALFLIEHPGCMHGGPQRACYSDALRHFVLALREQHLDVELECFADALLLPLGTLKDWLAAGSKTPAPMPTADGDGEDGPAQHEVDNDEHEDEDIPSSMSAQTLVVLTCWKTWSGSFGDFCEHLRQEQRIPWGRSLIANVLFAHGKRTPRRRAGRSPDERALRGAFQTFFGGAQWVGDGWSVPVTLDGERFDFNVELNVDAYSGGFVGLSIRDEEDSAAVVEALADSIATTGKAPLALLLDNKPSNHTPEVDAALDGTTLRLRATQGRPQNKAHCEGAFGLFQRALPTLALRANNPHDLARQVLGLVLQTCARTLNHRPRADRGGRSRVELYNETVTAEQINNARAALEERRKKQERARTTLLARQRPIVRALLDDAFSRLGLADPEQHLRAAIARYPFDVIVDGIAIFEAKARVASLPSGVDARYLLGIVRNLGDQREGIAIAEELLRARLDACDRLLAPLVLLRDATRAREADSRARVLHFVDLALAAERSVDRFFWLLAVSDEINTHAKNPAPLVSAVARHVHTTHRVTYRQRQEAVRFVVANVVPLS